MSVSPVIGPVQRPGADRDMTELFQRVGDLERYPPGRWIYVGTYPGGSDTTPDSPPFENGVTNRSSGYQRLRFRRTREGDTQIEGDVLIPDDAVLPVLVTTLPAFYAPQEDSDGPGVGGDWLLTAAGELYFLGDDSSSVPESRTLTAGAGLSGGGDLSADRTFDVNVDGTSIVITADVLGVGTIDGGSP